MEPERDAARPGPRWLEPGLALPEGLEAGLIGGFAVVLTFAVRDLSLGEPLYTPSVLGTLLMEGPAAARRAGSDAAAAVAYNAVHFAAWTVQGFVASWVARRVARGSGPRWLPWGLLLAALSVLAMLDGWVGATSLTRLHMWVGGLIGLGSMSAFLAWRHSGAWDRGEP